MQKIILLSIVLANIAIPIWASRERGARHGLKKMLVAMLVFNVCYLLALIVVYPRL